MKVTTPEISWHERDPIYSVDVQPGNRALKRLVSGGVDKFVRVTNAKRTLFYLDAITLSFILINILKT
jgi:hypothetical protein